MARTEVIKPQNDAYTGILAISFLALVGASVMMYLDADGLGKAPPPLKIDVPGVTPGKAGEGLQRQAAPAAPPAGDKVGGMGRAEPRNLPPLPELAAADAPAAVTPVKAEAGDPPLPPPAFVPPGN